MYLVNEELVPGASADALIDRMAEMREEHGLTWREIAEGLKVPTHELQSWRRVHWPMSIGARPGQAEALPSAVGVGRRPGRPRGGSSETSRDLHDAYERLGLREGRVMASALRASRAHAQRVVGQVLVAAQKGQPLLLTAEDTKLLAAWIGQQSATQKMEERRP